MTGPPDRSVLRWCAWWRVYASVTLVLGVSLDVIAQVRHGYPATLTACIRRHLGLEPATRYGRAGQAVLVSFLGWALLHLGWGILGPRPRRQP